MKLMQKLFKTKEERLRWMDQWDTSLHYYRKSKIHFIYNTKQYLRHLGVVRKKYGVLKLLHYILEELWSEVRGIVWFVLKACLVCIILSLFMKGDWCSGDIPYGEVHTVYHKTYWAMKGDTVVYETNGKKAVGKVTDTHVTKSFDKKGLTATLEDGTVITFDQIKGIYWGNYTIKTTYENLTEEEREEDMGIHGEIDSKEEFFYGVFRFMGSLRDDYTMFDRIEVGAKCVYYFGRQVLFRGLSLAGIGTD